MSIWDKIGLAFNILEDAEVMEEFNDHLWVKVDREMWEAFNKEEDEHKEGCPATDGFGCRCGEEEGANQ